MKADEWFDLPIRGYYVYALWSDHRSLPLYIGQSTNPVNRIRSHLSSPEKRGHISRVSMYQCSSKEEMDATEQRLIVAYRPPWNRAGLPAGVRLERRAAIKAQMAEPAELRAELRADRRWYKPAEVAERLGCTVRDVKGYFGERKLRYGRSQHVHADWVIQMLEGVPADKQVIVS